MEYYKSQPISDTEDEVIICYAKDSGSKTPSIKPEADTDPRKSADMYCNSYGMHGHAWKHCDFCTKIIKSLEFLKRPDPTKK